MLGPVASEAASILGRGRNPLPPCDQELFPRGNGCDGRIGKELNQMKLGLGESVEEAKAETN